MSGENTGRGGAIVDQPLPAWESPRRRPKINLAWQVARQRDHGRRHRNSPDSRWWHSRGSEKIELRLVELVPYKPPTKKVTTSAIPTKSFTLIFKTRDELPPFTSIHTISHPALGEFDLFLSKRKNEDGDIFYEATITHFNN